MACVIAVWVLALLSLAMTLSHGSILAVDPDKHAADNLQPPDSNN